MKRKRLMWKVLRSMLMIISIVAVLGVYLVTVSDLPSRIYTDSQQEFLSYNSMRSIQQVAPTLKFELGDDTLAREGELLVFNLPWKTSHVKATLQARYEEEGGVSVTVYDLEFSGLYGLTHTGTVSATIELFFPFPANLETLHEVLFLVDGEEPGDAIYGTGGVTWRTDMEPGDNLDVAISYRADGANSFTYGLMHNQKTDIDITVDVLGLNGSKTTKGSLPASATETTENSEQWTWSYKGLIADRDIRLALPRKLNFAQRVAEKQAAYRTLGWAAPWLVGLFLCAMGLIFHADGIRLRLESYLLMGLGIVLFFPLLTFFSGALPQIAASLLAFGLVAGLMLLFVKRAIGGIKVMRRTGILLVVFLGLFSLGIISPWRGLLLTTGGVVLVGTFMALYASRAVLPDLPTPPESEPEPGIVAESEPDQALLDEMKAKVVGPRVVETQPAPEPIQSHCPYCARELAQDYTFCPGCGHDTSDVHRCEQCGHIQFIPLEANTSYCVQCGTLIKGEKGEKHLPGS